MKLLLIYYKYLITKLCRPMYAGIFIEYRLYNHPASRRLVGNHIRSIFGLYSLESCRQAEIMWYQCLWTRSLSIDNIAQTRDRQ